jgi:NAD dependent epimerase/dehydratase family enzyme
MLLPFKLGLGGPVAGGKQCFSWIHVDDLLKAFSYAI